MQESNRKRIPRKWKRALRWTSFSFWFWLGWDWTWMLSRFSRNWNQPHPWWRETCIDPFKYFEQREWRKWSKTEVLVATWVFCPWWPEVHSSIQFPWPLIRVVGGLEGGLGVDAPGKSPTADSEWPIFRGSACLYPAEKWLDLILYLEIQTPVKHIPDPVWDSYSFHFY